MAKAKQMAAVITRIQADGFKPHISEGTEKTIIGIIGNLNKGALLLRKDRGRFTA